MGIMEILDQDTGYQIILGWRSCDFRFYISSSGKMGSPHCPQRLEGSDGVICIAGGGWWVVEQWGPVIQQRERSVSCLACYCHPWSTWEAETREEGKK